jgi:hypothetical protein
MTESALTPLLSQGISRELQDMLLHSPAPSSEYTAYASHLQMLDNRHRQHRLQVSRNSNLSRTNTGDNGATPSTRNNTPPPELRRFPSPRPIYAQTDECEFYKEETTFLGLIIGKYGIRMDPKKV